MPAIKKERLDREEMALAAFNQPMETLPEYLAPLAAAAMPVVTPHPPAYEHIFAHRAYLGFQEPHPHHPQHLPEDLMLERFSSIPDFQPFFDNGEPCIEVECGENKALLYINKLCQGSKGPSIRYRGEWLTPNEFQFVSGRETAKDWKRSIRHKGKSLKTLMSKGILQVHPPICDCPGCRISSPVNRGRLAEKRSIPLPPSRVPKKELGPLLSPSEDSQDSDRSHGQQQPHVKQEEDLHISIMKRRIHTHWDLNISFRESSCSRDSDLSSIISSLQQGRQLGMPESQSRCELKRNPLDVGLAAADEILGKRRVCSPNSSSECPLESKKARSESPKETSQTPALEEVAQMTPEEHYRRMMSALNEHGSFEEQQQQQQRLFQLANSMAVPSHGDLLRARQEVAAAAARTPGAMEAHIPSGSNSSSQRRKQGLPQHRDSHFPDREISHPPPLLSPQNAPHIALGPHLRPPFLGVPSALCQTPGYGFLQPAQAEMFARQQEMLRKQNLARLEMSAELIRQKELENLHRQRLLAADPLGLHPGLPPDHPALRSVHDVPEGQALRDELSRRNAMLVLRHNNAPLLSLAPGAAAPAKEQPRRAGRKGPSQARAEPQGPGEPREPRAGAQDSNDDDMKDSESDGDDKAEALKGEGGAAAEPKEGKDGGAGKACEGAKEAGEAGAAPGTVPCGSSSAESPSHLLGPAVGKAEVKYLPPTSLPAPQPLPFGFPYTMSPYFHAAGDLQEEEAYELTLPRALIDRSLKMNVWLETDIQIAGCLLSVWDFNDLCSFLLPSFPHPRHHGRSVSGWGGEPSAGGHQQMDSGGRLQLRVQPVWLHRVHSGIPRAGHRWGDPAPPDRRALTEQHGAQAGACPEDQVTGGQAAGPGAVHGRVPAGAAAAAAGAAAPGAGGGPGRAPPGLHRQRGLALRRRRAQPGLPEAGERQRRPARRHHQAPVLTGPAPPPRERSLSGGFFILDAFAFFYLFGENKRRTTEISELSKKKKEKKIEREGRKMIQRCCRGTTPSEEKDAGGWRQRCRPFHAAQWSCRALQGGTDRLLSASTGRGRGSAAAPVPRANNPSHGHPSQALLLPATGLTSSFRCSMHL